MLDYYFDKDPLKEMEQNHKQKLENALKIKLEGDEAAYLSQMEELHEIEILIEEFKGRYYKEEVTKK